MNEQYSLKMYLPVLQNAFIYGIHYLYLIGIYFLFYAWFGGIMPVISGIFYLSGLYVLCIIKQRYLTNLPLILSGILIFMTADTLFCYFFSGIGSAVWLCSYIVLISFAVTDIRDWKIRLYRRTYELQWYYIAEPVLMYIYGAYTHENGFQIGALLLTIFWLLTHFVSGYLKGIERYFEINRDVEGTPRTAIFQKNNRLLFIIVGAMSFLLLFSVFFRFDEIFTFVGMLFAKAIGGFMLLFSYLMLLLEKLHLLSGGAAERLRNADILSWLSQSKLLWLWQFLSNILFFFIIGCLIRNSLRYFEGRAEQKEMQKEAVSLKIPKDRIEDLSPEKRDRIFLARNNRERVRQLFYKRVKRQYKDDVPEAKTSQELLADTDKEKKLATLYDVARYSEHEISNAEVLKRQKDF